MKVFITGGTGFIGRFLVYRLIKEGAKVVVATRQKIKNSSHIEYINWFELSNNERIEILKNCDVTINLAGENIFSRRWTNKQKALIVRSRVETTHSIVEILNKLPQDDKKVFISASAVGYYGNRNNEIITEETPLGKGFLAEVCELWENEAKQVKSCRTIITRIGIVLHPAAGALKKMLIPFKFFVGGAVGSGKQFIPWVHIDDLIEMFMFVTKNKNCEGVYNFVSPNPCTMNEFVKIMGKILKRPSFFRVPTFILKIFLGKAAETLTDSQRVIPKRLLDTGYKFNYPEISSALQDLLQKPKYKNE